MNAVMSIEIRVMARQALAQMRAVQQQAGNLGTSVARSAGAMGGLNDLLVGGNFAKFGKQLQWTGRQLEYSFTLPLVLAGAAAGKWALDNERAMTRVRKVYGDGTESASQLNDELEDLSKTFVLLSNIFGVHQAEVIDIAGSWAQAGSAGVALARSTRLTLDTMILGEMDATKATEGLIAIQSTFRLSTEQLQVELARLNSIENATSISFSGLMDVMVRAGGASRTAGIDIRHLAAMAASLVPSAGSAAQAGNGLRTMISRIMSPTRDAAELMGLMGVNIYDATWQAKNGVERIEALAVAFDDLTQSQKVTVSAAIASRWQINRFDVLMGDILNPLGAYQRALKVTSSDSQVLATYTRELNTFLLSQPQAFKMVTTQIQNAAAQAMGHLLPAIVALLARIAQLTEWFSKLDPAIQQLVMGFMLFLAVVGPVARITGALIQLFHLLGGTLKLFGGAIAFVVTKAIPALIGGLGSLMTATTAAGAPVLLVAAKFVLIGAAIAGVIAVAWHFRDAIAGAVTDAARWLMNLPGVVGDVFSAVIRTIAQAMRVVIEWLSYLNPFARHSPSLVDNVRAGVRTILDEYASLRSIPGIIRNIANAQNAFAEATAGGRQAFRRQQFAEQRQEIVAVAPNAGPATDAMVSGIMLLESALARMVPIIASQARTTAVWEARLDEVNDTLEDQNRILDKLEQTVDRYKQQLDEATERLDELASTGIAGARALEDQIFSNETAQAQLNLEILRIRQSLPALDDTRAGLEAMRAEANALQAELGYAQDQLSRFTDANINGMGAMDDAIFANQMAQKQLRLEMLRMEEAGQSIDDVTARLAALQGEIEGLRARQQELRFAGAGSDILGPIDEEIARIEQARRDLASQGSPMTEMQKQMEELQRAGEILDLERAIQFDPLLRQIEQMTNMTEEMSFDQIVAGIQQWQPEVVRLTEAYNQQQAAVARDEAALSRMEAQLAAMTATQERQLAILEMQNEEMNLLQRIDFAPLERQLEQLFNPIREMPFDQLYSEIQNQQAVIAELETQYDHATMAVERQQAVVDNLRITRDAINDSYTTERDRLQELEQAYNDIESEIRNMESALNDFASTAKAAREAASMSSGEELFAAGAAGDFPVPGGEGGIGREAGSIEEFNKQLEEELGRLMADLGKIDILAPFKAAWNSAWGWMRDSVGPWFAEIGIAIWEGLQSAAGGIAGFFSGIFSGGGGISLPTIDWSVITDPLTTVADTIGNFINPVVQSTVDLWNVLWDLLTQVGSWIADNFMPIFTTIGDGVANFFSQVSGEIQNWSGLWQPLVDAVSHVGGVISDFFTIVFFPLLGIAAGIIRDAATAIMIAMGYIAGGIRTALTVIAAIWAAIWPTLSRIIETVFNVISGLVRAALEIIRGIITAVLALISGDWSTMWQGILTVVDGVWDGIYAVISGAVSLIGDIVAGVVEAIVGFFQWLYDTLIGNSIIPDLVNGIIDAFEMLYSVLEKIWNAIGAVIEWVWKNVIKPVWDGIKLYWSNILHPLLDLMLRTFDTIWRAIGAALRWVWDNMIQPVWNLFTAVWGTVLQPAMNTLQQGFKVTFEAVGGALRWVWNNVIQPVWNLFTGIWSNVLKPAMDAMSRGFRGIFEAIGGALRWVWDNTMQPVWNLLKAVWNDHLSPAMNAMKEGFRTVWDSIKSIFRNAVNVVIDIINAIIGGINRISDILPGVDFQISPINRLAEGGTVAPRPTVGRYAAGGKLGHEFGRVAESDAFVRRGFVTNMPRAIVGEGSPLYPEYVIPTDPTHRANAERLYRDLGDRLGAGVANYASGGVLGGRGQRGPESGHARRPETGGFWDGAVDFVGNALDAVGDVLDKGKELAIRGVLAPIGALIDGAAGRLEDGFLRKWVLSLKQSLYDFALGTADEVAERIPPDVATHVPGITAGGVGTVPAILALANRLLPAGTWRATSTYRPGSVTATGNTSYHSMNRAVDFAGPTKSWDSPELLRINLAFARVGGMLKELIYSGPGAVEYRNGARYNYTGTTHAGHHDHVHVAMRAGGIVTSPTSILAGEAGAEAVLPLSVFDNMLIEAMTGVIAAVNSANLAEQMRDLRYESKFDQFTVDHFTKWDTEMEQFLVMNDSILALNDSILAGTDSITSGLLELGTSISTGLDGLGSSLSGALDNINSSLSTIENSSTGVTQADVQALFNQYGVPIATGTETEAQRLSRIVNEVNSGQRTMDAVEQSIRLIAYNMGLIPNFATGGIVRARPGGTLVRVGEAGRDEVIRPLDRDTVNTVQGGTTININGNLEFPNIKKGDDAKRLIENLEAMI